MSVDAVAFVVAMFGVGLLLGSLIGPIPPIRLRGRQETEKLEPRYGDLHRAVQELRCGRCGQTYRKPAVGSWCCNSPRPHIPTS